MAVWERVLHLSDVWKIDSSDSEQIKKLASIIANRLEGLDEVLDIELEEERREIVDEFRELANLEGLEVCDFDGVMERLYDWADTPLNNNWPPTKVCWVATQ